VASLSQGRTAAAQCGLFTHKSVPVIFEPPCTFDVTETARYRLFLNIMFTSLTISSTFTSTSEKPAWLNYRDKLR